MKSYRRKRNKGVVVSDKMDKTITVLVKTRAPHPKYQKVVTYKKKYYAHDEGNKHQIGDEVLIEETRPLSKLKRWRVVEQA
jgi:small subunit ribosomal protein S17